MSIAVHIELGSWAALSELATPVRFAVFVDEQNVPAALELDEWDASSLHALARNALGQVVGTALLRALLDAARAWGMKAVELSAQTHAVPFYGRAGFAVLGVPYMEAGSAHVRMRLVL